jgi:regulatory protein
MVKIDQIQKKGKEVTLTIGSDIFSIEPDLLYQYHLYEGMEMDIATFKQLKRDQQDLYFFRFAISKLKKPLTAYEVQTLMQQHDATKEVIESVMEKLMKRKYIDDEFYVNQYIQMKKYQYGPEKIKDELLKKGVDHALITKAMSTIHEKVILSELIPSKIKSIKNKSKRAMMNSVKTYFLSKGFTSELIESIIISHLSSYSGNEIDLLKKAYEKLVHQYQKKYSGYELNQVIIQKLYQKGFKMEDIRNIIKEHLDA